MELEDVPHQYVKNWCKHIEIHQENVSPLGQMVGLPIGAKSISCRFHHGWSGMIVRQTASLFIESNCYDCPHHKPISSDNFGEAIISKIRDRRKIKNEVDKASKLLQEMTPPNPVEVLAADVETDAKARELAGLLSSEEHKQEAADKLLQATKYKPAIISPNLASVLIGTFLDTQIGSSVMETVLLAGREDRSILSAAIKGAIVALDEYRNIDSACMIVTEAISQNAITITTELVSTVVSRLSTPIEPFPHFGPRHSKKPHEGPEKAYRAIAERDFKLAIDVVLALLNSSESHLIATTCTAVQILLGISPDFIVDQCFQPLLKALSQVREDEEMYVDASICETFAKMLVIKPDDVSKKLFESIEKSGEDLQGALIHVFMRDEVQKVANVWIGSFISLLTSENLNDQTKFKASDMLSRATRASTDTLLAYLSPLFGVLAIITERLDSKMANPPKSDGLDVSYLEYQSDFSALSGVARNLREVVIHIGFRDIEKTITEIKQLIRSSDTKVAASFKSELLLLLGEIGERNAEVMANIVPIVFPHLFDTASHIVRGAAAEAYGKLVMRNCNSLPEDVLVALAALLGDQYLYPVRAAVQAFEWIEVDDFKLAKKVVNSLMILYSTYREEPSQYYLLEKISSALLNIANSHTSFLPYAALIIKNLAGHNYFYSAEDGLRLLRRLARGHKEYQKLYLLALLNYYSKFDLEITTSQSGYHSGKSDSEFEELYDLEPEIIKAESVKLLNVAQAQKEPHNFVHFACLLISVGLYKEATDLFERYADLLPSEERYDWQRTHYRALALLLRAETIIVDSDLKKAKETIEQALELIGSQEKPKRKLPFGQDKVIPKEEEKPDFYTDWLQVRKSWLNLNDNPEVLQKASEEIISRIERLKTVMVEQVDERILQAQEELALAAKFLAQWYLCVLNGEPEQDAKRSAIKARLSEALKVSLADGHELLGGHITDQIDRVDSLSPTEGMSEFLQKLRLFPMPMPRQDLPVPRNRYSRIRPDISEVEITEETAPSQARVAFANVLIDSQEIPQVISMVAGRIHDLRIEVELFDLDMETQEICLIPVSSLPEDEYLFPRQAVALSKEKNKYLIEGHLQFKHAQSEFSNPIDININAYFKKTDGTKESCTIFGKSQLKFRVINEARLSAQGSAEAKAVEKVFTELGQVIPDISSANYKNEKEIITCIINYAGDQLSDPNFTSLKTEEKDFQKDLSRFLTLKFNRTDVLREVKAGRGFLDILIRGVPVELKVFQGQGKIEGFVESSLPQVTQYVVSRDRRLGLLCILDISERATAAPSIADDVLVCKGRTEKGIDPSPEGVIGIVAIVVRGALYSASKLQS